MSQHKNIFVNPFHTKKVFANMKRAGKDFFGRITPLFDTMMVQASEQVGEDSDHPTDSNQIPIIDQPSTSSQPKQKQKSKRRQRKEAEVPQDKIEHEETQVLDLEKAKDAQEKEIVALKKRVQRLERKKKSRTIGLRRLNKVGMFRRVESSEDQESLGDHKDASKQGRSIEDIDANTEVTLVNETQERQDDDLMFDTRVLDDDEVFVDVTTVEKEEQSTKTGEAVTTAGVEDSVAPTITTTVEETLAQTLMEIKAAKPKAKGIVFHDQEEHVSVSKPTVSVIQPLVKDKGKGIMLERQKQEEANIALIESWENTQAIMEADRLLAKTLQTREREELTDEEKGKLEMKRVNTFVAMSSEVQESNEKKEEDKETDEVEEVEEDDEAKLKKHLVIKKDDDIPLATKPPVIFYYKLLKEGIMGIDREDLQTLWKIVKTKHGDLRPEDEHERVMWGDLKVMFKPDIRSDVWRNLQGYKVTIWKLIDSCGVHFVSQGIHVDPAKIESIKDWASPKTKVKFDWSDKVEIAFQLIKQKLCSAPIMALPKGSEDFITYCDASIKGLGAMLMQKEKVD
ncbi:ribonuclease H-like domain-containing protein [Tanacetum coccineum]